ncbi:MAG: DEAD/DEAH box helicase [Myxococcota bacterium]|nr:DEAD/DEAH box helicase [Myxococcota bacterium]
MIPSVVARQLQDNLLDYVGATLALSDAAVDDALQAHLAGKNGLFAGPYLRLGLPFASAPADAPPVLDVGPPFVPYAHQRQAFEQLSSDQAQPRNTLITTGTGSGKTECFLYPILDHCQRHRDTPGVQAILIYPMNALATDQARRFAQAIHEDPRLHGLRVGLYVGGKGGTRKMGPEQVIEDKDVLRKHPPQILLTNYKMLDFMLLRPDERKLWSHNGPQTLRYLVIDELHTFDGAQGSDVACLIRRLKARLGTPPGHLICAGTSATIGGSADGDSVARLSEFAGLVFDADFHPSAVVGEQRVPRREFLRQATGPTPLPDRAQLAALHPGPDAEAWLSQQQQLWLGQVFDDPVALGDALRAHPLLDHLLALCAAHPRPLPKLAQRLHERMPELRAYRDDALGALLDSFLGLLAHARRKQGSKTLPLVTLQMQLWSRELTRLLRVLPNRQRPEQQPEIGESPGIDGLVPRFVWWTEQPNPDRSKPLAGVQAHCRECGAVGLACAETEADQQKGQLTWDPGAVGQHWMESSRAARFLWLRPLDHEQRVGELIHWLDPSGGVVMGVEPVDDQGQGTGVPVIVEKRLGNGGRFLAQCPCCESEDALRILGARAASLSSVVISQLFQSDYHHDPKLLAFTDSVQDASHRAGFFGARSFRIHLRVAMQAVLRAAQDRGETLTLESAPKAFLEHWKAEQGAAWTMAAFFPPDLRELPEFTTYVEKKGKGRHQRLWNILRARMGWEFTREFGLMASLGRSLERTGASTLAIDPQRLEQAQQRFEQWLAQDGLAGPKALPRAFVLGLLHRMRHQGGIHHPYLESYRRSLGNAFLLNRRKNPHISYFGRRTRRPRYVSSYAKGKRFASPFSRRSAAGWYGDWMNRCLDWGSPGPDDVARVYRQLLAHLVEAGILEQRDAEGGAETWGLRPDALHLSLELGRLRDGHRHQHLHAAETQVIAGGPVWRFRAPERFVSQKPQPGFYAQVYAREQSSRVLSAEHTGLLEREPRTLLEQRFLASPDPQDPLAPNLLVCTPTLEMGVDIGDLSATLLCSVPPTPANYLQRVGRAGRKTGNALIFTLATFKNHDLYFFAEPERMLDGQVATPGVFLGATAMLQRQLSAWCMDRWAQDDPGAEAIPAKASLVLSEQGAQVFPGRFLDYFKEHRERLLAGFLERFSQTGLRPQTQALLTAWVQDQAHGLEQAIPGAFAELQAQIKQYAYERQKANERIKQIEADPTLVGDAALEIKELNRHRLVLSQLIGELRRTYPLNVLANRSLLPNYAFPEAGVELHSLLAENRQGPGDQTERHYDKRSYQRPAARALRELAPFNTFYADGHKVRVTELELGPKAKLVRYHRICPTCHHHSIQPVNPQEPCKDPGCPRCGDPQWGDKGQVRALLSLSTVRSVADRVLSTTVDDSEERERQSYHLMGLYQVLETEGQALVHPELGFGFEYVRELRYTELNTGPRTAVDGGPKLRLAGEEVSAQGFMVCADCGGVQEPSSGGRDPKLRHNFRCPQRNKDNKALLPLYLSRELRSEAVRFLMPFSQVQVEQKQRSFQAALNFALRRRFQGRPIHLGVGTMSEPVPGKKDQRKHFLVLLDTVPGGTGYLREYQDREQVFGLLQLALDGLRGCGCQQQGRDGCYLCLFAHQAQRHLPLLSSKVAQDMLQEILDSKHEFDGASGGLSGTNVSSVLESELEERFVSWLQAQSGVELTPQGQDFRLQIGECVWVMKPQVDLHAEAGQPMRADFVLYGAQGPALNQVVVIECDGFEYHAMPGKPDCRLEGDVEKRQSLVQRPGWQVFSLTWQDLVGEDTPAFAPEAFIGRPTKTREKMLDRVAPKLPHLSVETLRKLPGLDAGGLLLAWLRQPVPDWSGAVSGLCHAALIGALKGQGSLDAFSLGKLQDHLEGQRTLSPLPPLGHNRKPKNTEPLGVSSADAYCAGLVWLPEMAQAVQLGVSNLRLILRLEDSHHARQQADYRESWRRFLMGMNLLQFLPQTQVLLSSQIEELSEDSIDILAALGLDDDDVVGMAASAEDPGYQADPAAVYADALLLEEPEQVLIRKLAELGVTLPALEPPDLPEGLPADLVWPEHKLALCQPDDLEPGDLDTLRAAGWQPLLLPQSPETIKRALERARKESQ